MTIEEFLTARLDEEQASAEEAAAHASAEDHPGMEWFANNADSSGDAIVAMYPARALAEIAAKRAIIELWEYRWQEANDATDQDMNAMYASQATGLGNAVRFLAKVYSDHPDYDPDWRP